MLLLPVCTTDVLKCIIKNDCARDMFRGIVELQNRGTEGI